MVEDEHFVASVRAELAAHANPAQAAPMRAYMRDQFEFLGIQTPLRRKLTRTLLKSEPSGAGALLTRTALLWDLPQREFQYVAVDLLKRHSGQLLPLAIPTLLALSTLKSWWDSVDGLAGVIGDIVRRSLEDSKAKDASSQLLMDAALQHDNLWIRRIAMLHQLGWGKHTDEARLFHYATQLAPETDFFLRKAIGWALRDYAHHRPQPVKRYLRSMGEQLSPLTRREAGKHLG